MAERRRLLRGLVNAAILVAVGWGLWRALAPRFRELGTADLTRWAPDPGLLLVATVLLVGVYLAHAFLWRRILSDLELGRPGARTTLRVYFVAGLGRYIPGRLWQFAGLALLAGRAGLPPAAAAAAQVLGQLAFLATGLLFAAVLLPELWAEPRALAVASLLAGAAVAGWLLAATRAGHGAREWLAERAGARLGDKVRGAFALADRVRSGQALLWAAAYAATWVLLGLAFTVFTAAFVPGAGAQWRGLAGAMAAAYLAGYAVLPAPAGAGAREGVMVLLLAPLLEGAAGSGSAALGAATVVALASRLWFTAAELLPLAALPVLAAGTEPRPPSRVL